MNELSDILSSLSTVRSLRQRRDPKYGICIGGWIGVVTPDEGKTIPDSFAYDGDEFDIIHPGRERKEKKTNNKYKKNSSKPLNNKELVDFITRINEATCVVSEDKFSEDKPERETSNDTVKSVVSQCPGGGDSSGESFIFNITEGSRGKN